MSGTEVDHLQKDRLEIMKMMPCLLKLEKRNEEREREKEM